MINITPIFCEHNLKIFVVSIDNIVIVMRYETHSKINDFKVKMNIWKMFRTYIFLIHNVFKLIRWWCFIVFHMLSIYLIIIPIRFYWFWLFSAIFGIFIRICLSFNGEETILKRISSNILNESWLWFEKKHLIMWSNQ